MDTFDTSEEVMSEIDIEATEVDFGENFEFGVNDQERENNNEQEDNIIDGEKGEKSNEEEKLEEKEETLSQFITSNRGGSGEFKLEYEGTFVLSTLTEEQKSAQADLLTSLTANPEQSMMLPDHIDGKTTYFTAARMDSEGNLKYEIRSYTEKEEEEEEKPIDKVDGVKAEEVTLNLELSIDIDKREEVDKETLLEHSLLTEIEAVNEEEVEQAEEITQAEEQNFSISEDYYADVEQVISVEETQSELIFSAENVNVDNTHYVEQLAVDAKEDAEKVITERIIDLLKEEPQAEFIQEANIVIGVAETEQTLKDTQERIEPLVVTVEDETEKVQTLEDRIIELLRDEEKPIEVISEQTQISEVENTQQEQVAIDTDRIIEINTTTEILAEAEITLPSTYTTTERPAVSSEQVEKVVPDVEDVENQAEINEAVQASHIESIQEQNTEPVKQIFNVEKVEVNIVEEKSEEVVLVNEEESKVSSTIEQTITKEVNTDIEVEGSEHATIEQIHIEKTDIVSENTEDKENIITKTEEEILNVGTVPLNTERIIDLLKEEPQAEFVEEATAEEIAKTTEDKNITLQEVEISKQIVSETTYVSKETSVNLNQEVEKLVNISETTERSSVVEEIKAEEEVVGKVQSSDVVSEAVVNMPQEISKAKTILSEVVSEVPVAKSKEIKSESNEVPEAVSNNIQVQNIAKAEITSYVADNNKTETQNVRSINIAEKADQHIESPVVVKGEGKVVAETKEKVINLNIRKVDNIKPEKAILNNDKDIKVANTRESKVVTKKTTPEKIQVLSTKPDKKAKDNVLPFRARENKPTFKSVEVKATKPVVEKTVTKNKQEKTSKNTREAIVLKFNRNTINHTARNEAPVSLEKPKEEKRTTEESLKAKPLSGHEILLQILGISQNRTELRNAERTNSRSVPNINQEEQETELTKSIPSIYQQRNLNGITLKIAAENK